jgi:hypothetical protein
MRLRNERGAGVRNLFLLILTVTILAVNALAQEPTEKERMSLKGEVKTVREKSVEVTQKDGKRMERVIALEMLITLDRLGRMTEESYFKSDGTLDRRLVFTYDDTGNRTQKDYDAGGNLKYEALTKIEFDKTNGIGRRVTYGASTWVKGEAGKLHSETVLKYDSRGRVVESMSYGSDGSLSSRSVNKFGVDGGLDEMILYNGAGDIFQRHVRTDAGMEVFVYKDDGSLLSSEIRRKPTRTEFDSHGNWTREVLTKTVSKDGKVEEVTEVISRTLTYY